MGRLLIANETGALGDAGWCSPLDVAARYGIQPNTQRHLIEVSVCKSQELGLLAQRAAANDVAAKEALARQQRVQANEAAYQADTNRSGLSLLAESAYKNVTNPGQYVRRVGENLTKGTKAAVDFVLAPAKGAVKATGTFLDELFASLSGPAKTALKIGGVGLAGFLGFKLIRRMRG